MRAKRAYFIFAHYYKSVLLENMKRGSLIGTMSKEESDSIFEEQTSVLAKEENYDFSQISTQKQPQHSLLYLKYGPLSAVKKQRMLSKIQQILSRRQPSSKEPPNQSLTYTNNSIRRVRSIITAKMLKCLQRQFAQYDRRKDGPKANRLTLQQINKNIGVSFAGICRLYEEYRSDPLFVDRFQKMNNKAGLKNNFGICNSLTNARVDFLKELIKIKGPMTQQQMIDQMNKAPHLLHCNKKGRPKPILRKALSRLIRVGKIKSKQRNDLTPVVQNNEQSIQNRNTYAIKYRQITEDKNSEVFFLGQFSFGLGRSLTYCSKQKRHDFVSVKQTANKSRLKEDPTRNTQCLVVLSQQGVVYFQLFNNIFNELNFPKTLAQIGIALHRGSTQTKKYLIIETCFLHDKQALRQFQNNFGISVVFIPPKTPMLNPAQYFFSQLKNKVKNRCLKDGVLLRQELSSYLRGVNSRQVDRFFLCIKPYIELALNRQPFG